MTNAAPQPLYSRQGDLIEDWVSTRAGLAGYRKSRPPPPGFDPPTVQLVVIRYISILLNVLPSNVTTILQKKFANL